MSIVPTAKPEVTAQAFSGRQSIQTNADMLTGALGSSTTKTALVEVDQAIEKEERRFLKQQAASDERSLLEIEAELDTFEHDLFNNDQTGIYNQKLGNAQNSTLNSQDAFDGQAAALLKRTEQNPRIQNKLQAHLNARRKKIVGNASRWETDQVDKHTEQLLTSKEDRAREAAIGTYDPENMKQFNQASKEMVNTIRRLGEDRGEDEEVIERRIFEATSKVHVGVIDRMMKNDEEIEAQDYLEEHGDAIDVDDRIKLEGQVKEKAYTKQAQSDAEYYLSKAKGDYTKAIKMLRDDREGKRETFGVKQLKELRGEADANDVDEADAWVSTLTGSYEQKLAIVVGSNRSAKVKKLARGELRTRESDKESVNKAKSRRFADILLKNYPDDPKKQQEMLKAFTGDEPDLRAKTMALLDAGRARADRIERDRMRTSLKNSNEAIENGTPFDELSDEQKSDIRQVVGREALMRKREVEVATGTPSVSERGLRGKLHNMYINDKAKFAELNLYGQDYQGRLSLDDLRWAERLQVTLDKTAMSADKVAKKTAAKSQLVGSIMKASKTILMQAKASNSASAKKDYQRRYELIEEDVLKAVDNLPDDKVLSEQEQRDMVRALLLQGEESGSGPFDDDDARAYEVDERFLIEDFIDDDDNAPVLDDYAERAGITGETARRDTALIVQFLITRRSPVTIENIKAIFKRAQQ